MSSISRSIPISKPRAMPANPINQIPHSFEESAVLSSSTLAQSGIYPNNVHPILSPSNFSFQNSSREGSRRGSLNSMATDSPLGSSFISCTPPIRASNPLSQDTHFSPSAQASVLITNSPALGPSSHSIFNADLNQFSISHAHPLSLSHHTPNLFNANIYHQHQHLSPHTHGIHAHPYIPHSHPSQSPPPNLPISPSSPFAHPQSPYARMTFTRSPNSPKIPPVNNFTSNVHQASLSGGFNIPQSPPPSDLFLLEEDSHHQ
jgi:hypothetical protein